MPRLSPGSKGSFNKDEIDIDISSIPQHVQNDLAAATLDFVNSILQQPGGREMLDRRTAERNARQSI